MYRQVVLLAGAVLLSVAFHATAQQVERDVGVVSADVAGQLEGFSYREGPESKLEFRGTAIALAAEGTGEVEFQDGKSRVAVIVRKLPNPWDLGPYTTYVLWAVTVDGRANNLGSLELSNGRGRLDTSTSLSAFALIVTAEPYFAVTAPSKAVVLRNLGKRIKGDPVKIAGLTTRMDYAGLEKRSIDKRSREPIDLMQARYAVDIARASKAQEFAGAEFTKASELLAAAETAQKSRKYSERKAAPRLARDAVQMAEDARGRAVRNATAADADARREAAATAAREDAEAEARRQAAIALEESRRQADAAASQAATAAARQARADLVERLNRVLPTRETDRGVVAQIAGVQFATGAATLNTSAREALARFAGIVGIYPSMRFQVEGHTDTTGSYALNQTLSLQRAMSVRDYLIGQGVAASTIDVAGLGPDRPVADNVTAAGRAANRRVEIVITGGPIIGQ
ncbi:MAG: DUF4398 and OmpA-like domain-containing protein [Pseudomonadales bacterium]|nr:DUF4398 and OmpA-like domain-containing protein [Pseudomonadales bacterium]